MHNKLVEILEELNIPIGFQKFEGEAEEYIIFNIYDDEDSNFFDNENLSETYYICINYWTTKKSKLYNYKKIKTLLKGYDFKYNSGKDIESDGAYGRSLTFIYENYLDEGEEK